MAITITKKIFLHHEADGDQYAYPMDQLEDALRFDDTNSEEVTTLGLVCNMDAPIKSSCWVYQYNSSAGASSGAYLKLSDAIENMNALGGVNVLSFLTGSSNTQVSYEINRYKMTPSLIAQINDDYAAAIEAAKEKEELETKEGE